MSEDGKKYIEDPSLKWQLSEESSVELVSNLSEALKSEDSEEIREILKDPQRLRRMIIDRRERGKNLVTLRDSFDFIFERSFKDKDSFYSVDSQNIVQWMENEGLPAYLLNEMMSTAYHLKDNRKFFRLLEIITKNKDKFEDKTIFLRALQDLSTWQSTAEKKPDKEEAIQHNRVILASMDDLDDEILKTKARFGLTYNKKLKPKQKAADFKLYIEKFEESGDEYDAVQAMNEAAKSYLELSRVQNQPQAKEESLWKAEQIGMEALKRAEELNYSNALYKANLFLSKIYKEMGDKVKSSFYKKESNKLKRATGYRYSKNI